MFDDYEGKERRSGLPGRRNYDGTCMVHSEVRRSDLACMGQLKTELGGMKQEHEKFISKWTAGIITTLALSFLSVVLTLAGYQVKSLTKQIETLVEKTEKVSMQQATMNAVQRHVVEEIKQIQMKEEAEAEKNLNLKSDIQIIKREVKELAERHTKTIQGKRLDGSGKVRH